MLRLSYLLAFNLVKVSILTLWQLCAQRYAGLAIEQRLFGGKPISLRHLHHLLVLVYLSEHLLLSRAHPHASSRETLDSPL